MEIEWLKRKMNDMKEQDEVNKDNRIFEAILVLI